jgi:hypothetical protein
MNEMQPSRGALADMLTGRRGLNAGSAEALVRQIGQPPQTALPQSQPQTGMPSMPSSGGDMQLVTGRDGNKYQIVIDPKTGLQTFIPYREPRREPAQMPATDGSTDGPRSNASTNEPNRCHKAWAKDNPILGCLRTACGTCFLPKWLHLVFSETDSLSLP